MLPTVVAYPFSKARQLRKCHRGMAPVRDQTQTRRAGRQVFPGVATAEETDSTEHPLVAGAR